MYKRFTINGELYPDMGRDEEFGYIIKKFPQFPKHLILKTDLNRRGVNFTKRAIEEIQDPKYEHQYSLLFQWHQIDKTEERFELPLDIVFNDGTRWGVRLGSPESDPYTVDFIDDKFWLFSGNNPLEELTISPAPDYYRGKTKRGIPMKHVAISKGSDGVIFVPYRHCHYWNTGDQCKFCDMDYNTSLQMRLGRGFTTRSTPEDVYETAFQIFKQEGRTRVLCITGGSDPRNGYNSEFEFYLACISSINKAFKEIYNKGRPHIYLVASSFTKEQMKILYDEGLDSFAPNLEVWDPDKFPLQCPGKAKMLGRDRWIERMLEAVEIFGKGNVECAFVTGVIMAPPPFGYNEIEDGIASDGEGFRFCIFNHIRPISYNWTIEPGSYFYKIGATQPPLEFFIRLDLLRYELQKEYEKKYGHAFPSGPTSYRTDCWSTGVDWDRIL